MVPECRLFSKSSVSWMC